MGGLPSHAAHGKGMGKSPILPPRFPVNGKGDGMPRAVMGEGKGPPFPVKGGGKGTPSFIKGKGKGPAFPVKGKGNGKMSTPRPPAVPSGPPRHIVARMMNGRN